MAEMNLRHSISMDFFTLSASDNMHATTNYLSTREVLLFRGAPPSTRPGWRPSLGLRLG